MLSSPLAIYGSIAFILGHYFQDGVHWRRLATWLSSLGAVVLLFVLSRIWTSLDQAFENEPLFIGIWIALPLLWHYRSCGMLVPLQESLAAFSWSLIAISIGSLVLPRIPIAIVNTFTKTLAPSATESAAIWVLAISLSTVFFAALETDSRLNSQHKPYIFSLAFAIFFVGLSSLLEKPFSINMGEMDFLLLCATMMVAVRLRTVIYVAWTRGLVEVLLWLVLIAISLISLGFL
ncbi:MAG: hypothetical protein KDI54_10640 [Gammaproteobacteria bacterium]|nr:hypothetical protein [Gammaproteobacteria bacterium]